MKNEKYEKRLGRLLIILSFLVLMIGGYFFYRWLWAIWWPKPQNSTQTETYQPLTFETAETPFIEPYFYASSNRFSFKIPNKEKRSFDEVNVAPQNLEARMRTDGQPNTTIAGKWRLKQTEWSEATIFVPTGEDLIGWKNYIDYLRAQSEPQRVAPPSFSRPAN